MDWPPAEEGNQWKGVGSGTAARLTWSSDAFEYSGLSVDVGVSEIY